MCCIQLWWGSAPDPPHTSQGRVETVAESAWAAYLIKIQQKLRSLAHLALPSNPPSAFPWLATHRKVSGSLLYPYGRELQACLTEACGDRLAHSRDHARGHWLILYGSSGPLITALWAPGHCFQRPEGGEIDCFPRAPPSPFIHKGRIDYNTSQLNRRACLWQASVGANKNVIAKRLELPICPCALPSSPS